MQEVSEHGSQEARLQTNMKTNKKTSKRAKKIRVLIAKPGLDGHDRGAKVIVHTLRDAGMEVIYTGLHKTIEEIVRTALQEDVDAVGLSVLSGAHMTLFPRVRELMKSSGLESTLLFGGGIIPAEDGDTLIKLGIGAIFGPGTPTAEIIEYLHTHVPQER